MKVKPESRFAYWGSAFILAVFLLGGIYLVVASIRGSELSFEIRAPEHIRVSETAWEVESSCCGRSGSYTWGKRNHIWLVQLTNLNDTRAVVRLKGFDDLPKGIDYTYGEVPLGSTDAHNAVDKLFEVYEREQQSKSLGTIANGQETEGLIQEVQTKYYQMFDGAIDSVDSLWEQMSEWIEEMPIIPICDPDLTKRPNCAASLTIPPKSSIEIAIKLTNSGQGQETNLIKRVSLELVDSTTR